MVQRSSEIIGSSTTRGLHDDEDPNPRTKPVTCTAKNHAPLSDHYCDEPPPKHAAYTSRDGTAIWSPANGVLHDTSSGPSHMPHDESAGTTACTEALNILKNSLHECFFFLTDSRGLEGILDAFHAYMALDGSNLAHAFDAFNQTRFLHPMPFASIIGAHFGDHARNALLKVYWERRCDFESEDDFALNLSANGQAYFQDLQRDFDESKSELLGADLKLRKRP